MKLKLLGSLFIFSTIIYGEVAFKDVPKEHWAYKSINNLVNNQIIDEKDVNFNGNAPLTRYQFAYELSKLFNKLDMEKIDKKEIEVLRGIVTNFSAELNKIGFDYKEFEEKLSQTSEDIDTLKKMVEINNIKIKNLEDRLKSLEKKR
ncbi:MULTISPECIES: S-layer homology domain-containing protein [Fusobacterium]|uniref:S-layer homology domain-containing protein n=1 Tax=Fusobacterium TaxID=848 RepID=UPI001476F908|nr:MULTISPECIES: S-layer homology domain-containing protein [Fusobacterium]NME36738.1 S-layer homology domain-containing protein [Fusobacterium sp. FSA-380-WT-3A]